MLSSTDYAKDRGNPEPYLREIAETGFTHKTIYSPRTPFLWGPATAHNAMNFIDKL